MSSTSPVTSNSQYTAISMPKELLEIQPIIFKTFDNDRESVWDDLETSLGSNSWFAERKRKQRTGR
jgi:hypothetical protein